LKTAYSGQLLVAIGRDDNDNMVSIAMAVGPVENRETWTWFLKEMLEDIGDRRWTFVSDWQKGFIEALSDVASDSEHIYCLRYMYDNFKNKFNGLKLKDLFWVQHLLVAKQHLSIMRLLEAEDPKVNDNIKTTVE